VEVKGHYEKRIFILLVLAMVFALSFGAVMAQEAPFTLRISRDWGYGNGADINGRMSLSVRVIRTKSSK